MLLSGSIALSASIILMPLAVAMQALTAKLNQDKFIARLTAIIMLGWAIALAVYAQITGLVTLPFLMSMLLMVAGITYTVTTHPIKVWFKDKSRTTGLIAWAALMVGAIATCWMWLYATLDVSDPPSALNNFIWQLALIAGTGVLFASVFMRTHKTAHKLSRRIFTAIAVTALAMSHYFQHEIMAFIQAKDIETLPYFAAITMLGALATMTLSRFLSSMTYEHRSGMVVSLFIAFAIGTCMSILVGISQAALGVFFVAAILTLWFLAMTQNNIRPIKTAKVGHPKPDVIETSEEDGELILTPSKELSSLKEA